MSNSGKHENNRNNDPKPPNPKPKQEGSRSEKDRQAPVCCRDLGSRRVGKTVPFSLFGV